MELVKIKAYKYQELDDKAKENYIHTMWDMPFDYEMEDEHGNSIIKYEYFGDWELSEQIDFCECNKYLFDKYGNPIHHLIQKGE
jgi:hypothetical protein